MLACVHLYIHIIPDEEAGFQPCINCCINFAVPHIKRPACTPESCTRSLQSAHQIYIYRERERLLLYRNTSLTKGPQHHSSQVAQTRSSSERFRLESTIEAMVSRGHARLSTWIGCSEPHHPPGHARRVAAMHEVWTSSGVSVSTALESPRNHAWWYLVIFISTKRRFIIYL